MQPIISEGIHYLIQQGQYDAAYSHASFLIAEAKRQNNIELQLTSYIQRMKLNIQLHHFGKVADDLKICKSILRAYPQYARYMACLSCLSAELQVFTGNHDAAIKQYMSTIALATQYDAWHIVSTAYTKLSEIYARIKDLSTAINHARTAVLFAKMITPTDELYITRARLYLMAYYLKTNETELAHHLCNTIEDVLTTPPFEHEQLKAQTIWLEHYYDCGLHHKVEMLGEALLPKLTKKQHYETLSYVLATLIKNAHATGNTAMRHHYEQQLDTIQHDIHQQVQQHNLFALSSTSNALQHFKQLAEDKLTATSHCALLMFSIQTITPLKNADLYAIFETLQFFLQQTTITASEQANLDAKNRLYLVKEGFFEAREALQYAINQTKLHIEKPFELAYGHVHNQEHDFSTFDEALSLCHAYLYYNQWVLEKQHYETDLANRKKELET